MVLSVFQDAHCLKGKFALSLAGLMFLCGPISLINPALANPQKLVVNQNHTIASSSALFAGISDIRFTQNNRQSLTLHFEADLPFEYRIVPIDDHRIAIKLIQGKISQKLKGAPFNKAQRLLNVEGIKGIERVTLLQPFPGMRGQDPETPHPVEEIQISGKNIGKKHLIITGAQPADLTPAPIATKAFSATQTLAIPSRRLSSPPYSFDSAESEQTKASSELEEPFLRLSKTPSITSENETIQNTEENTVTSEASAPANFRHIEMKLQPEQKPQKQKPLEPDPKWNVPARPSSNPERSVPQERLTVLNREEVPLSPKQTLPPRDKIHPLPQEKRTLVTYAQPGHIQRPPHLTKDGKTEEGRFASPPVSNQSRETSQYSPNETTSSSPEVNFINVSDTQTSSSQLASKSEQFSPWSTFGHSFTPPKNIKRNPNAPPIKFSIIQTEPTPRRSVTSQNKETAATRRSDSIPADGILLQAVDTPPTANLSNSPILPPSKVGIVSQALKRALVQSKQDQYQEALLSLQQAKALSPAEGSIYAAEGEVYLKMGALQKAKAAYEKAYSLKPDELFHERYAVILYQLGQKTEATHILENLITLNNQRPEAQLMLGTLYQEMGQPQKALLHLKQAVTLSPKSADAQYNLATAWHSIGDKKQALRHYQQALQLSQTPKQQKEVQDVIQDLLQANGLSQGQPAQ